MLAIGCTAFAQEVKRGADDGVDMVLLDHALGDADRLAGVGGIVTDDVGYAFAADLGRKRGERIAIADTQGSSRAGDRDDRADFYLC